MSILNWLNQRPQLKEDYKYENITNGYRDVLYALNDPSRERKELEWASWYSADADSLSEYYQRIAFMYKVNKLVRPSYMDYFWCANKEAVKKTHSGLAREMCDTIASCVGVPTTIKVEDEEDNETLAKILDENNFKEFLYSQISKMCGLGTGAIFPHIINNKVVIEYVSALDCHIDYIGSMPIAIHKRKYLRKGQDIYQFIETRGIENNTAYIDYHLYKVVSDILEEVSLSECKETENLNPIKFNNIHFLLAVPCVLDRDDITGRGTSFFANKIALLDDLDQNISQEANVVRASTPVERIDINSLEVDESGNRVYPDVFGKRFIYYKSSEDGQSETDAPTTQFYQVDYAGLSNESLESLMRCLSGKLSPATLGYDLARNSSDLAQREKEKITFKSVGKVIDIEEKVLAKLFNILLAMDKLIKNKNATYEEQSFTINFPDYSNNTFEAKLQLLSSALSMKAISPERYVTELWGDSLNEEERQQELEYITKSNTDVEVEDLFE